MNLVGGVFIAIGSALLGLVAGACLARHIYRTVATDNDDLRAALRAIRWGHAGVGVALLRYIDRVLGDEAA